MIESKTRATAIRRYFELGAAQGGVENRLNNLVEQLKNGIKVDNIYLLAEQRIMAQGEPICAELVQKEPENLLRK
jgi:hypothetical protein